MDHLPLHLLSLGRPYLAGRRHWPEGADYSFRSGQHELRLFLAHATPAEVRAIDSEPAEFGLLAEPPGLFLIARFGPGLSFDCSYDWHRVDPAERTLPPAFEETSPALRALLTIILVKASSGIVLALRATTFSPEFTRALHRAIAGQAARPPDPAGHDRWVAEMTRHTPQELWARCSIRCHGGD